MGNIIDKINNYGEEEKVWEESFYKRAGDGEIPVMNTYGELWSNQSIKVLKILNFKN